MTQSYRTSSDLGPPQPAYQEPSWAKFVVLGAVFGGAVVGMGGMVRVCCGLFLLALPRARAHTHTPPLGMLYSTHTTKISAPFLVHLP